MLPLTYLATDTPMITEPPTPADPARAALIKTGTLLIDLAEQTTKLAGLVADHQRASLLAGGLCRRAEAAQKLGRKLALWSDPKSVSTATLINDAILALDGIALDIEYAAELEGDSKIKNQVARARLAVTMAGCAIDDARRTAAASS